MSSVWIVTRPRQKGDGKSYRVLYRLGGHATPTCHGGQFRTQREAQIRKRWIAGELAARRSPNLREVDGDANRTPMLGEASETWRRARIDVVEGTQNMHRSAFGRIFRVAPRLRSVRVDELAVEDVTELVAALIALKKKDGAARYKRGTIKKSTTALAQLLDHYGVEPNPARDKRVKLPRERKAHVPPPLAEHVERVAERLPRHHVIPFLVIDECGPRVSELETAQVGDLDEHRRAIRVRWTVEKNDRYRHLELPDDVFAAIIASLPAREDRNLEAPLFPDLDEAALRTAITRACKATGTPHFSPHGLRRRRGSLHYKRTGSLADVAELLGDSKRVAADHYVYALTDYREVDRSVALARVHA
jgi:integrase